MEKLTAYNSCHQAILLYYRNSLEIDDVITYIEQDMNDKVDRHSEWLYEDYEVSLFEFIWLKYLISKRWIKL